MKTYLFWSVFTLVLLFGYSLETKVLEDVQHISALGYDYVDEHRMKGTAAAPFYPPGKEAKPINAFFTATGHTGLSILGKQQTQAQKRLGTGRLNTFLISKELAENGVSELADPLGRSTAIGMHVYMAVVDGSAEELLTFTYPNTPTSAGYLSDFMEKTMKNVIPEPTIHYFLSQYEGFGQDPFLPILEKKEDLIHYKGLALFKDDQYVGELSLKDSAVFKLIYESGKTEMHEISFKDKKYVTLENIRSKVKYKVSGSQDNPQVAIHVSMVGQVRDAADVSLKGDTLKEVEEEWSKENTKRAEKIMIKLQELNTDPLGIGEKVRSHFRNFDKEAWKDRYPNVPVEFDMKVRIKNTGIME